MDWSCAPPSERVPQPCWTAVSLGRGGAAKCARYTIIQNTIFRTTSLQPPHLESHRCRHGAHCSTFAGFPFFGWRPVLGFEGRGVVEYSLHSAAHLTQFPGCVCSVWPAVSTGVKQLCHKLEGPAVVLCCLRQHFLCIDGVVSAWSGAELGQAQAQLGSCVNGPRRAELHRVHTVAGPSSAETEASTRRSKTSRSRWQLVRGGRLGKAQRGLAPKRRDHEVVHWRRDCVTCVCMGGVRRCRCAAARHRAVDRSACPSGRPS